MSTHVPIVTPLYAEQPEPPDWTRDDALDEPSFGRRPRRLPQLSGEDEVDKEDPESAVLGVYLAERKPRWTKDAPTHEGWWFCRPIGGDIGLVVRVQRFPDNSLRWSHALLRWESVRTSNLEWSERAIAEPEG